MKINFIDNAKTFHESQTHNPIICLREKKIIIRDLVCLRKLMIG